MKAVARPWNAVAFKRAVGVALAALLVSGVLHAAEFATAPTPDWVSAVRPGNIDEKLRSQASDGSYYLLVDTQIRVTPEQRVRYTRYATKALNAQGVESIANIQISFDPSFQQLTLHAIDVVRGSITIRKLAKAEVKILQRETELEALIFDGGKTASIFLDDVRVGDIVDYAFSVSGRNPVFGHTDFGSFALQYADPVARIHARLLVPLADEIIIAPRHTELTPTISTGGDFREYRWQQDDVPIISVDAEAPSWYDPYPNVQWSEFSDWAAVSKWALPLYQLPQKLSPTLQSAVDRIAKAQPDPAGRLLAALRLVQSDIRYLGVEIGSNSHAPNPPSVVFERRFGDCKDKTLLTLTMLSRLGIDARAALVNTSLRRGLKHIHASPAAFDHVIVHARLGDVHYWLDPTRAKQVGGLAQLYQPDYDYALLVDPQAQALVSMKPAEPVLHQRRVDTRLDASAGFDQPVPYTITTTLMGGRAESLRQALTTTRLDDMQKQYLNYYARFYPGITIAAPLAVNDDLKRNRISTTESYLIKDIGVFSESTKRYTASVETPEIKDFLNDPETSIRTAPLALQYPLDLITTSEVLLPAEWPIETDRTEIVDHAFTYERSIEAHTKRFVITNRLRMLADEIPAKDTARYVANLARARAQTGYEVYWSPPASAGETKAEAPAAPALGTIDRINWLVMVIAMGAVGFWTWLALKAYRYDPAPQAQSAEPGPRGISGWLLLPAFGVIVTPMKLIFVLYQNAYAYAPDTWAALTTHNGANYHALWAPCLLFELIANLGLLVYAALLMALFFRRRSSLPNLYIGMLIASMTIMAIDHAIGGSLPIDDATKTVSLVELTRTMFASMVWIPYFLASRRVKSTFVVRRVPRVPEIVAAPPPIGEAAEA